MNRDTTHHHVENVIERGWQFYADRPWAAGLFYWTGFDYRGEPNPLIFPAHDSEFGILDYCGFWKDEAWYLKSWWTAEPTLHIFPHWNLQGHEGETVELWAYSNCDEVELIVNGKKLGRQTMPKNGHLKWNAVYQPGRVVANGYKNGKRILTETIETTKPAVKTMLKADRSQIVADGRDLAVITIEVQDQKGHIVPDACPVLTFTLTGNGRILGVGNGDPSYPGIDHPNAIDCPTVHHPRLQRPRPAAHPEHRRCRHPAAHLHLRRPQHFDATAQHDEISTSTRFKHIGLASLRVLYAY